MASGDGRWARSGFARRGPTQRRIEWLFGLVALVAAGCSFTFDSKREQCAVDNDCTVRGAAFAGTVCVSGVCQFSACTGAGCSTASSASTTANTGGEASLVGFGDSGSTSDGAGGSSFASSGGQSDASEQDFGSSPETSVDAALCPGPDCPGAPECTTTADCEAKGMVGAECVESVCWTAMAQCTVDAECLPLGLEYEGGRCLQGQCRPNPLWRCDRATVGTGSELVEIALLIRDAITLGPKRGVKGQACQKLDVTCQTPIKEALTDADGYLRMVLPADFGGYIEIREPGYFPAMYFLPPALPLDGELSPFPLMTSNEIATAIAALALGAELSPERGHMMLIALDCYDEFVTGATFDSPSKDEATLSFYVRDLVPDPHASGTGNTGDAGYLNFQPGVASIDMKQSESGLLLGRTSVLVRAGYISVAYIRPDFR